MYVLKTTISKLNFAGNKVRQLLLSRKLKKIPIMQSDTDSNKTVWDPINVLNPPTHYKYAVIILNRPLLWKRDILFNIWEKAQINATVNGGTLRWIHYLEKQGIDLLNKKYSEYVPDLITGDMDSCSPAVLEQMKSMGSMVVETPDQNLTDYTKALIEIGQLNKKANLKKLQDDAIISLQILIRYIKVISISKTYRQCDYAVWGFGSRDRCIWVTITIMVMVIEMKWDIRSSQQGSVRFEREIPFQELPLYSLGHAGIKSAPP
ncbi:uncharacterized protein LOC143349491 isoform X5 [Colletes latitarsis]|uniref:uncharacterized protein LOC143349491 isoform X5 n=1 Tax=Colletes latitarsis TaxID=2605962 RepID=UPI004036F71B